MIKLSKKIKFDLFTLLKEQENPFGKPDPEVWILNFINDIWDLLSMPSTDPRFTDAYGDLIQHTVNNDDWSLDQLFIEKLHLLEDDKHFSSFIETIVHPKYRLNEDEIIKFVLLIDPYLEKAGYKLAITDYDENGLPIFSIKTKEEVQSWPSDIKQNNIPFFVEKKPTGRSISVSSHKAPSVFPSFVLAFNKGWNDYGYYTSFSLFYYLSPDSHYLIGDTKIITADEEEETINAIPEKFNLLDHKFCSLGQSDEYYENLKKQLDKNFEAVLFALKDAAFFPEIHEKFEKKRQFIKSLIRYDISERFLREVKYRLYGYEPSNLYKFQYRFKPLFSNKSIEINFDFNNDTELPNRIYALIGKNGTGKTQLITSLPIRIARKEKDSFYPQVPLFSKVISVSYSIFDSFELPRKTSLFNYVYCGLRNDQGDFITSKGLVLRFHNTWKKIESIERINKWRKILLNFIEEDLINEFLVLRTEITSLGNKYEVSLDGFSKVKNKLSSGQNIILYVVSEIVANIRYDSLLLYDEPETHLHPNAITQLMNTIYELVNEFQSYCIIATHSPLIIRELLSKNVYIIERHENDLSVRRIGVESFGENLTTLRSRLKTP